MSGTGWRRPLALALSLLFVAGSAGEAYGFHDCPHHHPAPAAPSSASSGGTSEGPAPKGEPLESSSHGPCTCIGTCHGAASAPTTALDQETPTLSTGEARRLPRAALPEPAPPRDATLLLPYPTGPPARGG